MSAPVADPKAIAQALDVLFEPDDVIELRAIFSRRRKRTDAGYFDGEHREVLIREAVRLNKAGAAVYVNLNPLDPQLLARYSNRVQENASATATDANVIRRRRLLLDFDPVRPKDTSATDAQLEAAKERARRCYRFLRAEGWPAPVIGLPNDSESRDLVKRVLETLAACLDDDIVKLDISVSNAGRIVKLYGTVANKGDDTPDAPWRLSRIVCASSHKAVLPIEKLRALLPDEPPKAEPGFGSGAPFDLEDFLSRLSMRFGIEYQRDIHEGRERYKLSHCPFNPEHGPGEAAVFRDPNGRLGCKCQHASCADKSWQDLRELVDGRDARSRRTNNREYQRANGKPGDSSIVCRCMADIEAKQIRWFWPRRIARGKVTLKTGHPGLGKSQVGLSLAAIVSIGGTWPVDRTRCAVGSVVILSAEDDAEDTIRPRLEALGADLSRIHILDAVREREPNGEETRRAFNLKSDLSRLEELLDQLGDVALIIIDPISAYLGNADSYKNAEVRALLAPLSELAARHQVAVLCVSHPSKSPSQAINSINGSVAFVAAARAAWLVIRDPENKQRRLLLPIKNNIGTDQTGLAFTVEPFCLPSGIETSRVVWEPEAVTVTADEVLAAQQQAEDQDSAIGEAKDWLRELLTDVDWVDGKRVKELASQSGISERTLYRAAKKIGVKMLPGGFGNPRLWHLCPMSAKDNELGRDCKNSISAKECHVCQSKNVGTDGGFGTDAPPSPGSNADYEMF